jgi:membrane protease YdiL (CAAX protease family)
MLKNKALTFVVVVYTVTALYSLLYLKFPLSGENKIAPQVITMLYMFIPLVCAAVLAKLVYREQFREAISLKFKWNWWYLFALLVPVAVAFMSFGFALLLPGVSLDPEMSAMLGKFKEMLPPDQYEQALKQADEMKKAIGWDYYYLAIGAANGIVLGATVNAVFGFGEEAGWRGYLLNNLKHLGFFKSSLIIGAVWGVWHLPVIIQGHNYGKYHVIGVFMMTAWTIFLTPLMNYVVKKTGSVISAAVFHGVLNAVPGVALAYVKGGDELIVGITGLAGFMSLAVLNGGMVLYDKFFAKEKLIF